MAPSATQRRSTSFCVAVNSLWAYFGGITFAALEKTRTMISLASGLPGTIGVRPEPVGFVASSRMSRRRLALRAFLSGPWHRKQVSDMIGRTSRLKPIEPSAARALTALAVMTTHRTYRITGTIASLSAVANPDISERDAVAVVL